MREQVTLLRPDAGPQSGQGMSSAVPPDLLEQVRRRLRLLALLMLVAFAVDPLFFIGRWAAAALNEAALPSEFFRDALFYWGDVGVVVASAGLWWIGRNHGIPATRLHILASCTKSISASSWHSAPCRLGPG